MYIIDRTKRAKIGNSDFPNLEGSVSIRLHNPTTGKTEIIEGKNIVTNAVKDIFDSDLGGIVDYDYFMPLYQKMFGGVLCFNQQLDDTTANDYYIPSAGTNSIIAHAGQTTYSSAADDLTRGNPNTSGLVLTEGVVTQSWEWASTQGNGTISSIALCHADVGDAGVGGTSNAFKSFNPFITVACKSANAPSTIDGSVIFAINNNYSYSFKVTSAGVLTLYKTPIILTKAKLQGSGITPLTDYTTTTTIALNHGFVADNSCSFYYDFTNSKLLIFSVYDDGSVYSLTPTTLTIDTVNLTAGTATSATQSINLTDCYLWTYRTFVTGEGYTGLRAPRQATIIGNYLYFPTCTGTSRPDPDGFVRINLTNFADVDEITINDDDVYQAATGGVSVVGSKAVLLNGHIFDGTTLYQTNGTDLVYSDARYYTGTGNIVAHGGFNSGSLNRVVMNKLYLATKYNLQSSVTKTAAQSMTITYTLTEV